MNKLILLLITLCTSVNAFHLFKGPAHQSVRLSARSKSVPFLDQPPALSGKLPGDVGFDPLGLSSQWPDVR